MDGHTWYFHKLKVSENATHECNNCNTLGNKCNKMFIIHYQKRIDSN